MPLPFLGRKPADAAPDRPTLPAIHLVPPPQPRPREVSAISLTPSEQARLTRHNLSIGKRAQRLAMQLTFLILVAPVGMVLMRIFFRVRTHHGERLSVLHRSSGIFAIRHFYEMDPFVPFYAAAWQRAILRPHMVAYSLASRAWTRTPLLRAASWCLGVMGLSRGLGLEQSATERAVEILQGKGRSCAAIYPTGPIGQRREFSLGPGVGYLALKCPDLPVVPVTMTGVQQFRWKDVLRFKRPFLHVSICPPVYGRDARGLEFEDRADDVCDRIAEKWAVAERDLEMEDHRG